MSLKEFSGFREITVLTLDTYLRKMLVVSTVFSMDAKAGETAVAQASELNSMSIDFKKLDFKTIEHHNNLQGARDYHNNYVETRKFTDCEQEEEK